MSGSVLVDTYTAAVFPVKPEPVLLTSRASGSHDLFLRPVTAGDNYSVSVWRCCEDVLVMSVLDGAAALNGVRCEPGDKTVNIHNGSFIELGTSYRLQYKANNKPHPLMTLPRPPPGYQSPPPDEFVEMMGEEELGISHDSLNWSHDVSGSFRRELASGSFSGSVEGAGSMSDDLRGRLKRIAKEVTSREGGYKDRRPPPPYEQTANSINYQLLHHKHPQVTKALIDSLYGALKEMEFKDRDLPRVFHTFLASYSTARAQGATPTCMMPADLPVVKFALDMLLHIACIPEMTSLVDKVCPLWMSVLAILSTANQNRAELIRVGVASKLLSLMNLSIVSEAVEFQELGWVVLGGVVNTPGTKPVILEASLSLILSLVAKQLNKFNNKLGLVIAILHMLSKLAALARKAVSCDIDSLSENADTYTPLQGAQVLSQLKEADILDSVMRVPPVLRTHPGFHDNYCSLLKALHPVRVRRVVSVAPPKPARARRLRRQTIAISVPPDEKEDVASPSSYSSWSLPKLPGKRSCTVTNLIGSSDHLTHPLDNDEICESKNKENVTCHVTSEPHHVTSEPEHVTSEPDHVTSEPDHVTTVVGTNCSVISLATEHPLLESPQASPMKSSEQSDCFTFPKSDTLSRDVASLLDSLRAPLPCMASEKRRNSHYFRHSVKKRSERQATPTQEAPSSSRMEWGVPPRPVILSHDSEELLSPEHTLLEEVFSGHEDIALALSERSKLLGGVLGLWQADKGLQAMTNLIQASFSEDSTDLPLFMDALTYFLKHKGPWTLAVCCVLLPTLKNLVSTQRENSCIHTIAMVILSIVERFSDLILSAKVRKTRRRLSERADREQLILCHNQLYSIRQSVNARLDLGSDLGVVGTNLRKVHAALKPYKQEIKD